MATREIPSNVRVIVSASEGRSLVEVLKRGWRTLEVAPLGHEDRMRLIRENLGQFGPKLDQVPLRHIAIAPQCGNALFLTMLLGKLRLHGMHETLMRHIEDYMEAQSLNVLFRKVLERWETDYERERPGLVCDELKSYLGLSERTAGSGFAAAARRWRAHFTYRNVVALISGKWSQL